MSLKKEKEFKFEDGCEESSFQIKKYLVSPLVLLKLKIREVLDQYSSIIEEAIGLVLIRKENNEQISIYYTRKTL